MHASPPPILSRRGTWSNEKLAGVRLFSVGRGVLVFSQVSERVGTSILEFRIKSYRTAGLFRSVVTEDAERMLRWEKFREFEAAGRGLRLTLPARRSKIVSKNSVRRDD